MFDAKLPSVEGQVTKYGCIGALLALFALSCSQPASSETQPLSASGFRDAVAAEIARQYPALCIDKPDDQTINIGRSRDACKEAVMSTTYFYEHYKSDPAHLQTYVRGLTATLAPAVKEWGQAPFTPDRTRLIVAIRPAAYAAGSPGHASDKEPIWRPFVGDLIAILMQKDGALSRSITPDDLKALALSEPAAWELAQKNTRSKIGSLDRSANAQGAETVTANSGLATSNLWLAETCKKSGNNFDAFVVQRETYFYADQKIPAATSMLAGYAAQLLQTGQNTYSSNLISCIDGRWYASAFDGRSTWRPIVKDGR